MNDDSDSELVALREVIKELARITGRDESDTRQILRRRLQIGGIHAVALLPQTNIRVKIPREYWSGITSGDFRSRTRWDSDAGSDGAYLVAANQLPAQIFAIWEKEPEQSPARRDLERAIHDGMECEVLVERNEVNRFLESAGGESQPELIPGKPGRPELELWKPVLMRVAVLLINDTRDGHLKTHAHYAVRALEGLEESVRKWAPAQKTVEAAISEILRTIKPQTA